MLKLSKKNNGVIRQFDIKSKTVRAGYYILFIVSVLIVFVSVAPIMWIFLSGFKSLEEFVNEPTILPKSMNFESFIDTWKKLKFIKYYLNTLYSVIGSVVCAVIFNALLGYSIAKIKPKGWNVIYGLIMLSLMLPVTTCMVPLFINITKIGLQGSFLPVWLSMGANAFYVILYKNFFDSLPQPLIEAAKLDGCNDLQLFFKIVLPLSRAINMVIVIFAINASWSDFLLPYLVLNNTGKETVMIRLFQFRTSNATDVEVVRAIVFSVIPPIILFGIFQKYIIEGISQVGIKA